jgi:hypothetical protein
MCLKRKTSCSNQDGQPAAHTSPRCLFPEKEEKNEEKYASTKERYPRGCVYVRKEIALFINHIREIYPIPNSIGPTGQP